MVVDRLSYIFRDLACEPYTYMLVDEDNSDVHWLGKANKCIFDLSDWGVFIHDQVVRFAIFVALAHPGQQHSGDSRLEWNMRLTSSPIAATKNCLFLKFLTLDDILDI